MPEVNPQHLDSSKDKSEWLLELNSLTHISTLALRRTSFSPPVYEGLTLFSSSLSVSFLF